MLRKNASIGALVLLLPACQSPGVSSTPSLGTRSLALSPAVGAVATKSPIRHVVIIVQENRTVDNLFHGFPGADTVNYGINSFGKEVPLRPEPLAGPLSLGHSHRDFTTEYADGRLDGFNLEEARCVKHKLGRCPAPDVAAYSYVPRSEVRPYWQMAKEYTFGDEMFESSEGPSFPAHQYIVSGTSAISDSSDLKAASNPKPDGPRGSGGCSAPADDTVVLIDPKGLENQRARACFNRISLMALLDEAGLDWRYYGFTTKASIWNAPNAIEPIWQSRLYRRNDVDPPSRILRDVRKGDLASVTWVTPSRSESDHPGSSDGSGPSWVAGVVNAIGESQYWKSTAIFIIWDDWGGWYDHVVPHIYNSYELGLRVPLIVVSPYAKRGYVSHVAHEFGSILRFTEGVFNLRSMGTTDARSDDLSDCFDFGSHPHAFKPITAELPADYFLNETDTNEPPDDD